MSSPTSASSAAAPRLRRNTMLWALLAMALFLVSTLLGLFLRLFQGNSFPAVEPVWFYSALTLHALIMVGAWFLGSMAGVHYLLSRYVRPSSAISELAMGGSVVGVVLISISTLLGKFGVGWYFLFPLPLYPNGAWSPWATIVFFTGLAILAVFWLAWVLDLLRAIARRYSLSMALGWHILRGAKEPEVPPLVLITTVSLVVVTAALVAAALVLALFFLHGSGRANVDALLMKNLTFLFGHIIVNITLYLGVAILYELLPAFAGRPWKTSWLVAFAWNAVLLLVLFAYLHHLYMDFAQPRWVQVAGQTASYFLSLPAAAVSVFGALALIYRSGFRWTMASRLLVCGVLGWVIGGIAAVVDATVAVNSVFHNTLWVPAHFHTYYLMGVVLMVLAFFDHLSRELTGSDTDVPAAGWILSLLLLGGYGFLAMFYYGGATSVPRRFATYPEETLQGVIQARVAAAFVVLLLAALLIYLSRMATRCLRAFALCRNAS
ncbi:MAG: cbb3-type cytochrome c oxidase subunit I [Bryobacterales bacterium]|nr:cbb3-type cytochrome c oxidase subunit I [Bryobacterales bacterium]